jgi:hypothetical protein
MFLNGLMRTRLVLFLDADVLVEVLTSILSYLSIELLF